ncbi:MAG: tonB-system energizer ExbB [Xanthobacteraceae bacterium]
MTFWNPDARAHAGVGLRLWAWRLVTIVMLGTPVAAWAQTAPPGATERPAAPPVEPTVPPVEPSAAAPPVELPSASPTPPVDAVSPSVAMQSPLGAVDLTPWGMYLNADPVVKGVLIGLLFASVVTWTIWLAKTIEILNARRRVRAALTALSRARTISEGAERLAARRNSEVRRFVDAATTEMSLSADVVETEGIKERVASRLDRLEASFARRITRGTGLLATIGATAPFVGLAGTVWGIMNSFIGISKSQTTNLAVVAPGIAEALLATAFGLAAAIPAVVIYNVFARQISGYRALLGDASAEVMRLVSRDLDRSLGASISPARRPSKMSAAAE